MNVTSMLRSLPVIRRVTHRVFPLKYFPPQIEFDNSSDYWESRYKAGGNSGAGSYNRLAKFKAEFINRFLTERSIDSTIEFGSGDGAQLRLTEYRQYTGVDVSKTAIDKLRIDFNGHKNYEFLHTSEVTLETKAQLGLSLDVIYHLVEDEIFEIYMHSLFNAAQDAVIIYSSNEDRTSESPHVRHRRFIDWIRSNRPDFLLTDHLPNKYPFDPADWQNSSFADFYTFVRVGLL